MKIQQLVDYVDQFIDRRFRLTYDQAELAPVIDDVRNGISFKGSNMRALMIAIVICSVGLNMNSTAVVIGAMLLSPLMGPIIGFGVGLARYDLEMIFKSLRNIGLAAIVSLIIAICYFTVSPLTSPTSEIIARTSPTIWDVIIAFCGGLVGIIALTRKEKSLTIIPGVAIATALMPPLCTAGFGIANGMRMFALRALYLFWINGVFIAAATYLMSRYIKFPYKSYSSMYSPVPVRIKRYTLSIALLTLIPSIVAAVSMVQSNIVDRNVSRFMQMEITDKGGQIITKQLNQDTKTIALWTLGVGVEPDTIEYLNSRLGDYQLSGFSLSVNQGLPSESDFANQVNTVDQLAESLQNIKSLIDQQQQDLTTIRATVGDYPQLSVPVEQLYREMKITYPQVSAVTASIIQSSTMSWDGVVVSTGEVDEIVASGAHSRLGSGLRLFDTTTGSTVSTTKPRYIFVINLSNALTSGEQQAITERLQTRLTDVIVEDVVWKNERS